MKISSNQELCLVRIKKKKKIKILMTEGCLTARYILAEVLYYMKYQCFQNTN
jgi:hypothetical protein